MKQLVQLASQLPAVEGPRPWTPLLRSLRARVEAASEATFNSVLLNYYRDGNDSMGLHPQALQALRPPYQPDLPVHRAGLRAVSPTLGDRI